MNCTETDNKVGYPNYNKMVSIISLNSFKESMKLYLYLEYTGTTGQAKMKLK